MKSRWRDVIEFPANPFVALADFVIVLLLILLLALLHQSVSSSRLLERMAVTEIQQRFRTEMTQKNGVLEKAARKNEFAQIYVDGDLQRFQFRGASRRSGFFRKGDASVISPHDLQVLKEFGTILAQPEARRAYKRIIIEGHADAGEGDGEAALQLSLQRAVTVGRWLQECGMDPKNIEITGRGSAEPLTRRSGMTAAELAIRNRRLEIVIVYGGARALNSMSKPE